MESTEGQSIDAMDDWYSSVYRAKSARQQKPIWNLAILALVVCLHAGLIACLFSLRASVTDSVTEDEALQVTFIDRLYPSIPEAPVSDRASQDETSKSRVIETATPKQVVSEQMQLDERPAMRLTLDADEWQPLPIAAPKNPLNRQYIALPGRSEPFVEGIKMAGTRSPRQKLAMIGKLFGAVDYDACDEARKRMASGRSQVDEVALESDLRAIELHCR